jgi:hypothetical protein
LYLLGAISLLEVLGLLGLGECEDGLEHATIEDVLEELVGEGALGPEGRGLEGHELLRLAVEGLCRWRVEGEGDRGGVWVRRVCLRCVEVAIAGQERARWRQVAVGGRGGRVLTGFSTRQLTKILRCDLIWLGLSSFSIPLCFFFMCSSTFSTTWSAT